MLLGGLRYAANEAISSEWRKLVASAINNEIIDQLIKPGRRSNTGGVLCVCVCVCIQVSRPRRKPGFNIVSIAVPPSQITSRIIRLFLVVSTARTNERYVRPGPGIVFKPRRRDLPLRKHV